jgi:hypothetical protein
MIVNSKWSSMRFDNMMSPPPSDRKQTESEPEAVACNFRYFPNSSLSFTMRPQLITRGATLKQSSLIPVATIEKTIYLIRGQKVMLDADLASLYQVATKALNQAVRRNRDRFPDDFMFQLTTKELEELNRSQIVTASQKHRDPRFRPYAFTEQGVAMLSSVLHSKRAILVNIEIMRTFARLRLMLATNTELSRRLAQLESKYDRQFKVVFDAIRQLMSPAPSDRKQIGFRSRSQNRKR